MRTIGLVLLCCLMVSAAAAAEAVFPELTEVASALRYPRGAKLSVAPDGTYRVNGEPRYLLGMFTPLSYSDDLKPTSGYPESLRWIYETPLDYERAQRLGFDTIGAPNLNRFVQRRNPDYRPLWLSEGEQATRRDIWRSGLPIYVDMTCFEWTNGALVFNEKMRSALPPEAINVNYTKPLNRWTPYGALSPAGRALYLEYWTDVARYAKDNGVEVVAYELFNESGYDDPSPYNRALFETHLRQKYGTIERLNARWRSGYASFAAAAAFKDKKENPGLFVDWGKFMEDALVELCRDGFLAIRAVDPEARVAVQLNGSYVTRVVHHSNFNMYRVGKVLNAITLPTEGGNKSEGLRTPTRPALYTPDMRHGEELLYLNLYRVLAEGKPIHNNENYTGNTYESCFNSVWLDFIHGSSATYAFTWMKRGWEWHPPNETGGRKVAERVPYAILNPYAFAPGNLTAFADAKADIARFAKIFQPRDRGVDRNVAVLLSFPTERYAPAAGGYAEKNEILDYVSALEFSHYPIDVVLEEHLAEGRAGRYKAIVAAGVRNIYPETATALLGYVRQGGLLVLAREFMPQDEYGFPVETWGDTFALKTNAAPNAPNTEIALAQPQDERLPGKLLGRNTLEIVSAPGWEPLGQSAGKPVLLRKRFGEGWIYLVTPEMKPYTVAAVLGGVLARHDIRPEVHLTDHEAKDLATNIEMHASRLDGKYCLFLYNHDYYAKVVDVELPGNASAFDLTARQELPVADQRAAFLLPPRSRVILGIGDAETYEAEFGPFAPIPVDDLLRRRNETNRRLRETEEHKITFAHAPNLALTRPLDLRPFCNRDFFDAKADDGEGGWTDQGPENSLNGLAWGLQTLVGVPCEIVRPDTNMDKSCIVLSSISSPKSRLPDAVSGIPVRMHVKNLFFFHTAAWATEGKPALRYRVHYADGEVTELPMTIGKELDNWWLTPASKGVAWRNLDQKGFYLHAWKNPRPQTEITALDIVSARNEVVPVVLAITVEQYDAATEPVVYAPELKLAYGWLGLEAKQDGKAFDMVPKGNIKDHAGVNIRIPYNAGFFRRFDPERKDGWVCFEVKGGKDIHGIARGDLKLQIKLFKEMERKIVVVTDPVPLESYLEDSTRIDAEQYRAVRIPLARFNWKETDDHSWRGFNGVAVNFRDATTSGFSLRNLHFQFPPTPPVGK